MNISHLVDKLQVRKSQYGDIEVRVQPDEGSGGTNCISWVETLQEEVRTESGPYIETTVILK